MSKTDIANHLTERRSEAVKAASRLAKVEAEGRLDDSGALALEDAIDEVTRIDTAARSFDVKVKSEPSTYRSDGPHSWITDLITVRSELPVAGNPHGPALERLQRNNREALAVRSIKSDIAARDLTRAGVTQERAGDLSNVTNQGGEFLPPVWLTSLFASTARSASPLTNIVRSVALPDGTMSLSIPTLTAASAEASVQNPENSTAGLVSEGTASSSITQAVVTITNQAVISQQQLDVGGFDTFFAVEAAEMNAARVEDQLINGTGSSGQLLGLLNVSGINAVTYTSASPTVPGYLGAIAQGAAQVGKNRLRPASAIILSPRRYPWIAGATDNTTNVVQRPGTGTVPADGDEGPTGPIFGRPVYESGVIPNNLGAGTNQDVAIVLRAQDIILAQSAPVFQVLPETDGNQLSVILEWHTYVAAFTSRYPGSISVVSGTGCITQTGY